MRRVLFVCTGNIFRSLTAEYALKHALQSKGFDVSRHQRRTLTEAIRKESHLVIAMSTDHRAYIQDRFGHTAPLFLEACGELADALPDVEEVVLDYQSNPAAVDAHVRATIERILALTPRLAIRLDDLLRG